MSPAALQTAQDAVDHPRRSGVFAHLLHQRHGAVYCRAGWDFVQKQELVGPQPQGLDHLGLHPLEGHIGKLPQVKIQQKLILLDPEAKLSCQRPFPGVQAGGGKLLFQHRIRPAPLMLADIQTDKGGLTGVHLQPLHQVDLDVPAFNVGLRDKLRHGGNHHLPFRGLDNVDFMGG